GEVFPVEVLLTSISSDERNQILHTVWRDITERKNSEKEILELKKGLEIEVDEKTKELKEKVDHLQRFFDATVNRELRMKELSDENEKLKAELEKMG
ncbi:MAG: hypothetical protein KAR20_28100, partial [Candidatus Heimdallarchaeota archaeon]|nr:hypothetical protein [Candidatus Heimdallarchaeota archaeon]